MITILLVILGKSISRISKLLRRGNGSTWPGHIALMVNKHFIASLLKNSKTETIFVAGTNGKTTTSALLTSMFREDGKSVLQNTSGANLLNGIASSLLLNSSILGKIRQDVAIFEVDEGTLPLL